MLRLSLVACLFVGFAVGVAHADYTPAETSYPGWRISSIEDAYAGPKLRDGIKHYPLTNLVDGDSRTAWVFEGPKWDGKENEQGYQAWVTKHAFQEGVGQVLLIQSTSEKPILVDAVGIINGYAKDAATYRRNNRVVDVSVETSSGPANELLWRKPTSPRHAHLRSSRSMQMISLTPQRVRSVKIVVNRVETGRDNDLAISELQLYYKGRALIAKPTPYVLYQPGSECGDGNSLYLVATSGRPALEGASLGEEGISFGFAGARLAAVQAQESLTIVDLTTGKRKSSLKLPDDAGDLVCPGGETVHFETVRGGKAITTYRLDLSRSHLSLEPVAR